MRTRSVGPVSARSPSGAAGTRRSLMTGTLRACSPSSTTSTATSPRSKRSSPTRRSAAPTSGSSAATSRSSGPPRARPSIASSSCGRRSGSAATASAGPPSRARRPTHVLGAVAAAREELGEGLVTLAHGAAGEPPARRPHPRLARVAGLRRALVRARARRRRGGAAEERRRAAARLRPHAHPFRAQVRRPRRHRARQPRQRRDAVRRRPPRRLRAACTTTARSSSAASATTTSACRSPCARSSATRAWVDVIEKRFETATLEGA